MCLRVRFGLQMDVSIERAGEQKALPVRARGLVGILGNLKGISEHQCLGQGLGKPSHAP